MASQRTDAGAPGPIAASQTPAASLYLLLFALAAAIELLASLHTVPVVWQGGLLDPDSYMRLLRIEQGLKLGHLVNSVQRDDSGAPLVIEWSRLFDAGLVALASPLAPFVGWRTGLRLAGVASGPLFAGLLGMGLGFAAAPISDRRMLWAAAAIASLLAGIREFQGFGVVHYHIAMLVAVAFTAGYALRAGDGGRRASLGAGLCGALALWVMPETMPFVLFAFLGLGYRWLFRPIGAGLALCGAAFSTLLVLAIVIDPPHGGLLVPEIDRLSIVYGALGATVCAVTLWLAALDRWGVAGPRRGALGIAGALAGFLLWLGFYPTVALGPYALVSPEEMRVFFGAMLETQPVHDIGQGGLLLGPGLLALAYVGSRTWRARGSAEALGLWLIVAASLLLALGLTARFIIFAPFPAGLAAALLPVALTEATVRLDAWPVRAAAARITLVLALLIVPFLPAVASHLRQTSQAAEMGPSCSVRHAAGLLAQAAGKIVLTSVNVVPELLYRTRIVAVGSLYQHGIEGYLRARAAWRAPAGGVEPPQVRATGARYVLFCAPEYRHDPMRSRSPEALGNRLEVSRPPPWLQLVGKEPGTGLELYRIVRQPANG